MASTAHVLMWLGAFVTYTPGLHFANVSKIAPVPNA